jgi:hypothetical protein
VPDEVRQRTSSTFAVSVDGADLDPEVERILTFAFVEDNLNLPDSFYLAFLDPNHEAITKGRFKIGSQVKIKVRSEANPSGEDLFSGEVTALETEFDAGKTRTIVRGLDHANRL